MLEASSAMFTPNLDMLPVLESLREMKIVSVYYRTRIGHIGIGSLVNAIPLLRLV